MSNVPNVLNAEPMRAFARRVGAKIGDEKIASRYERMALGRLFEDPRNFRLALQGEIESGPDWARAAYADGRTISVFVLSRAASARLHNVARRLADTCRMATTDDATRPRDVAAINAAREFLDKFNRASFDVAARKALYFSRLFASWADDRDHDVVCAAQSIAATQDRVWRRLVSVGDLRATGREFKNCLARTTRSGGYGAMLLGGMAQFWVLRDARGAGLIVAMAPLPSPCGFTEVRGPRNAPVLAQHVDLLTLADAIGIPRHDPPPGGGGGATSRRLLERLRALELLTQP